MQDFGGMGKGIIGKLFILSTLFVLGWFYTALAGQDADQRAAKSAGIWLSMIDEGRYTAVWDAAAEYIKKSVRKKRWMTSLADSRTQLGKMISRDIISVQEKTGLPGAPCFECFNGDRYVIIAYHTVFENNISATETVTAIILLTEENEQWKFFDYDIRIISR